MIALLAESKTMKSLPAGGGDNLTTPIFQSKAYDIMESLRGENVGSLADILGLSPLLASKMVGYVYDFFDSGNFTEAIKAFTGEVFRGLDFDSMTPGGKDFFSQHFLIVSSLYGLLFPSDAIHPYRLDYYNVPPFPGVTLSKFWKKDCTIALGRMIRDRGDECIINLLPGEAMKCIDWKLLKGLTRVIVPLFRQMKDGEQLKPPFSAKLKALRGEMSRRISEERIITLEGLKKIQSPNFIYSGRDEFPDYPVFLC